MNESQSNTPLTDRVAVVLVEPWEPGNVGSTARAMQNLGLHDLRLVVEREDLRARLQQGDARRMATHALGIVDNATFFDDLPTALADCVAAYGFSARMGRFRQPRSTLTEASERMRRQMQQQRIALVFGTEERGLSTEHLSHTTELVTIPTGEENPVFNLSQAVLIGLWELCKPDLAKAVAPREVPLASLLERQGMRQEWSEMLETLGYGTDRQGSLHRRILRRLLRIVESSGGERDDVSMLRGVAQNVRRRLQSEPPEKDAEAKAQN